MSNCIQNSRIFLSIGYDICFVVALVKTIRVAYIFLKVFAKKPRVNVTRCILIGNVDVACVNLCTDSN